MWSATPWLFDRDPRLYVEDMLEFCQRAREYAAGKSLDALLADRMRYDAILRNLDLIGEASTHVQAHHEAIAPDVPWRLVIGTRNRLAHACLGIAAETVFNISHHDLPALELPLKRLIAARLPPPPPPVP